MIVEQVIRSYGRAYIRIHAVDSNYRKADRVRDMIWKKARAFAKATELDEMMERILMEGPTLRDAFCGTNKILNVGLAVITGQLAETAAINIPNQIQLGSSAQAVSVADVGCVTALAAGGLSEAVATATRSTTNVTNDTFQLDYTFTQAGGAPPYTVAEMAVRTSTPTGYARLLVSPSKSVAAAETVAVTYKHTFTTA